MKHIIVAIFDSKAESYGLPHVVRTAEMGMRNFEAAVRHEGSDFNRFPDDYTLHHLGTFDDETGEITPVQGITCLVTGTALRIRIAKEN